MSPMLIQFLTDWLKWAEADAPDENVFRRFSGLCANLVHWCYEEDKEKEKYAEVLSTELTQIFTNEFGDDVGYPFGYASYNERFEDGSQHQDPNRLAWVRKKLYSQNTEEIENFWANIDGSKLAKIGDPELDLLGKRKDTGE